MTDEIISRVVGNLGHITLNRPKALNALTLDMCVEITRLMVAWEKDPNIGAVLVDGSGDRAFCAGGDVILLHDSGKAGDSRAENFWRIEYALNDLIHRYSKPYITMIDGIVMGGGVGLSVHGRHRVAGDTTFFAMPETGIGYFPDVGGTFFLPRLGMAVGQWLGLTGARLKTAQVCALGIANSYIPSEQHSDFIEALSEADLDGRDDAVLSVMVDFVKNPPTGDPIPDGVQAFDAASMVGILASLDADPSDWAKQQADNLRKKSPVALAVTFESIRRGAKLNFRDAMSQELDISLAFLNTQDFYEGIRAQLIDKDRNPKWSADTLTDVTAMEIARHFMTVPRPLEFLD
jgi:enoyl-CoA hydratase